MIDTESGTASIAAAQRFTASPATAIAASLPPQPKTVRETGLEAGLLVELVAKAMLASGKIHLPVLTGKLRLSVNVLREVLDAMLGEQLVESAWRGDSELDVHYQLTQLGRQRAAEFSARCRYAGPAPVTLQAWRDMVLRQSARHPGAGRIGAAELAAAFADEILEAGVRELLGAALQSSRALLLYGPSGAGKSTLARKLGTLQQGLVAVPYAILVEQHIVSFHDPQWHLAPSPLQARHMENQRSVDTRWTLCQRPQVVVGGELDRTMLGLRHDPASGVYHAPPHLLANNGMLVVDDLGRQQLAPAELLNRWTGPLEQGTDQLAMEGGHKVSLPFDATLVFATNFAPQMLLDEASMRRLGYKIHVGALSEAAYRKLFLHQCRVSRVAWDEDAYCHLIARLHGPSGRALLAATPRELLGRIADFAAFAGQAPRLSIAALEQAWSSMFAGYGAGCAAPPHPPAHAGAMPDDSLLER
jgi:energy-coupling factor transporter ATP-binding protein EcfA2